METENGTRDESFILSDEFGNLPSEEKIRFTDNLTQQIKAETEESYKRDFWSPGKPRL